MCIFCGLMCAYTTEDNKDTSWYYYIGFDITKKKNYDFWYNVVVRYGNWMIIFTNFIPISMIVSLELVKFI